MSEWLYIFSLLISGFVLILLELFIIPGFGIIGIIGLIILGIGCFLASRLELWIGVLITLISIFTTITFLFLFFKTKMGKKFTLETKEEKEKGFQSADKKLETLMGKEGIIISSLRPAGVAEIEEKRVDVVTTGEFIEKESKVKVIYVEGNKVVVEKINE